MRLLYLSNARLPTPMAHGLQIMQNCEAFADQGVEVVLWCARRYVPPDERTSTDVWAHYGVKPNFRIRRLPCLDLTFLAKRADSPLGQGLFRLQFASFALIVVIATLFTRADVYYSRDGAILALLGWFKARDRLVYEAHRLSRPGLGARMQRWVLRRSRLAVAITTPLAEGLAQRQADQPDPARIIVAHDGIRRARFDGVPTQTAARQAVGWPLDRSIVGYVGRFKTLGMDKGIDTLIDAIAQLPIGSVALGLVGGPAEIAEQYRAQWIDRGLPATHFLYSGQVLPERVPLLLSAFDLCVMPHPWTEQFAYYTSPIKLFEYMASGRALIASDLPAWAEVITDQTHALLVPPSDAKALADAIKRLIDDPALRERLAQQAYERVMSEYTWDARARQILAALR
ncbi:MAG: glycosyltransferase family 4 protein [Anaerolineae bacterium]|nr:glycosyltransferase family 4 protein [Anaerolineae bacterium]